MGAGALPWCCPQVTLPHPEEMQQALPSDKCECHEPGEECCEFRRYRFEQGVVRRGLQPSKCRVGI